MTSLDLNHNGTSTGISLRGAVPATCVPLTGQSLRDMLISFANAAKGI